MLVAFWLASLALDALLGFVFSTGVLALRVESLRRDKWTEAQPFVMGAAFGLLIAGSIYSLNPIGLVFRGASFFATVMGGLKWFPHYLQRRSSNMV